ncbi:MAG: hypothetical protein VXX01_06595 [Pseudomonadota bacterium]|nr:hypothetical protein [Pseudomonadota bacterium]
MFASLFQGAQVLAGWAFGWLVPAPLHPSTELSGVLAEAPGSPAGTPLPGQGAAFEPLPGGGTGGGTGDRADDADASSAPTPRGSFEQIDRQAVREATEQWQAQAPAPGERTGQDTEVRASLAEIDQPSGQDPQLTLVLALGDGDGLDPAALSRFAIELSTAAVFSPIVQPQVDIAVNDTLTGALITLQGTANAALDDVYWRIDASLPDAGGDMTDLNYNLAIWNTDLL